MISKKIEIDGFVYSIRPLTRRQFKSLQPIDDSTIEKVMEMVFPEDHEDLEDRPLYHSTRLFGEIMDLTRGESAEKN